MQASLTTKYHIQLCNLCQILFQNSRTEPNGELRNVMFLFVQTYRPGFI